MCGGVGGGGEWGQGGVGAEWNRWCKDLHRCSFVQTTTCRAIANRIQSSEFDGNIQRIA